MLQRILTCAFVCAGSLVLAQEGATEPPKPRVATDANFDAGTLVFISTDNAKAMKESIDGSDFGRFLAEPSVKAYMDHFMTGLRTEFERSMPPLPKPMEEMTPEGGAEEGAAEKTEPTPDWNPGIALVDLMYTMWDDAEGRAAAAFGLNMQRGFQPNLLMHVEAGDKLGAAVDAFCTKAIENADRMDSVPVESLKIAGFEFRGIEPKSPGAAGGFITMPDGLYFGRRGNEFVLGISRSGISEYLQGSNPNSLGNTPFYNAAVKQAPSTPEAGRFFFNMKPIWELLPMGAMFGGAEFQQIITGLNASGLTELQGVYYCASMKEGSNFSRSFVGRKSTKGLLGLVRSGNTSVPNFVPVDTLSFTSMHVDYPKVAPLVEQMARALIPGLQDSQIAEFRGMVQAQIGATVEEALGALTGETVMMTFPTNSAALLMNPEAATSLALGMKVSDEETMSKVFATVGASLPASEMHGRTVLTIPGGMPIRLCHDGDWIFAALSESDLNRVLSVRANPEGPNLRNTEVFEKNLKTASGAISYANMAESLAGTLELMGVMLAGTMMIPGVGEMIVANPDLMYAVTSTNLPKAELLRKHFGPTVGTLKVSDDGFLFDSVMLPPSMTPKAPAEPEAEPAPKGEAAPESQPKDM